jgi:hypothetical protein
MDLTWFMIALFLAVTDEIHSTIMWKVCANFYIILGGLIKEIVGSPIQTWLIHEGIEAVFHFIILSIIFLSVEIGFLAAIIHFMIDVYHELSNVNYGWLHHRSLHFAIESLLFILILNL